MPVTMTDVALTVAAKFQITPEELKGPRRHRAIAHPRWVLMLLAWEETANSYSQIARYLGKDHTTILYGCNKAKRRAETHPDYALAIESCREMLASKPGWKAEAAESIRKNGLAQMQQQA